ncbi:glycosyltransferase [Xanthomonas sacchari]|uniref:Glycosyltransferase n=1 Tax=Xanthomonas sacchari TaxID=56458 RepID=A0AA46SVT7_9XANT|nr:glycosyltransferase [Xanthomonas sacchari]UYK89454.1 glycosyltransferase [Xanthomonas sacchari]
MSHDDMRDRDEQLDFTGERFIPGVAGEIEMEHYHRYQLACQIVPRRRVLDIACGEGYGSALMARYATNVIGVDIDGDTVAHARKTYINQRLEFLQGSCAAIPVADSSIDVVVSFETIEHHDQHQEMMAEIVRVLSPGGVLLLSSPDRYEYSERTAFRNNFHVKELYKSELQDLLAGYFRNIRFYGQRATMVSMIGDLEYAVATSNDDSLPVIHYWTEGGGGLLEGVRSAPMPREPVYLIAIASDGDLPQLPSSVFEVPGYVESRVKQVAADYQREISRIGEERDCMLKDKDDAWQARVDQVALDYQAEIKRISLERDQFLAQKDLDWRSELENVATEYCSKLSDVQREHEEALSAKDANFLKEIEEVVHTNAAHFDNEFSSLRAELTERASKDLEMLAAEHRDAVALVANRFAELQRSLPLVSLIVVNYNGMRYLKTLLSSLAAQDYPKYEVILVDNASADGSVAYVAENFPWVRIVESGRNLGFAGGNNVGIQAASGELIGLINNDTEVSPSWLTALVEAMMEAPSVSAVGSKIVFFRRYVELTIRSAPFRPSRDGASTDTRELGLLIDDESEFLAADYRKSFYVDGFWGTEGIANRKARWTNGVGVLRLPVPPQAIDGRYQLVLKLSGTEAAAGRQFFVSIGDNEIGDGVLTAHFKDYVFSCDAASVDAESFDVINNAGTLLDSDGEAGDRGIYEVDRGQYDHVEDVQALCGASMLIKRSALVEVGLFDSDFFMYYEDTDLSWRLRRAGGLLRYIPSSVVRHVHTGSSVEWSPMFVFHVSRNHVFMKIKHAPAWVAAKSYAREVSRCVRATGLALSQGFKNAERNAEFFLRLRVQYDLVRLLPRLLKQRWGGRMKSNDRLGAVRS